ncbi:hypothetical protein K1T71_006735 [Dendrolimus kikuchii]|uniref:Uncharacterized protein n=1 Tax=Dendrolimus kikuchii TaxID=765133 RepID=A0ACC1D393_9NEOP|nr:hypothetical protein K1T71_006735 [Dendrolimus kikuchii]
MPIKKLPHEVQCILRASCQMNTFSKAVEELVFNSLDAGSTSIAIRVNVQEGAIQVIDNGCGIRHSDIWSIGQRHMTSNYVDVLTLKTAPDKYGLRGEALANIIAVSRIVNIVSRLAEKDETWIKNFSDGREKKIAITSVRPSKGTTVEIKGFLYNLNIRKNMINNIDELQNLRTFLEQLSLVHSNVSLSLRDDAKNEILFQIHKKRDIYQTLLNLFNIKENNVQELSVEKNKYKVKGYIGKNDDVGKHWIYLNGKFVTSNSKLYKIVNDHLSKSRSNQTKMKLKSKVINDDENYVFTNKIPFYFIFISCPCLDYDINHTLNQPLLEFNDWNKINILLEKLIKFYIGDINLKPVKNPNNIINIFKERNTRDQVNKIIQKVLGNRSDKPCITKMQNGIKGPKQDNSYNEDQYFDKINKDRLEDVPTVNFGFDIRDRLRFLPKGMSQIFENCNTKTACDYNFDEDYFHDSIYDNFANDVQINTEIYEPMVQNLKETATKTIEKFSIKLVQDNASLKFSGQHLKDAKILGQVDGKFIAAIIDGFCTRSYEIPKFLVLFDQHAVHERIRLERNLSDYVSNNQWVSVPVEKLTLVLSKDEIISLHNYKEKFEQLGLQWTILDDTSIEVDTIPQAILSKHPRQFEKVIKAVKGLIAEEVNMIKMQRGCISLYPKSIMDLVFSESCRYAIKFGDNLSKADCEELLSNLSDCKTPFQCAHGRPVMAVVMNYSNNSALRYKINPETLRRFKKLDRK